MPKRRRPVRPVRRPNFQRSPLPSSTSEELEAEEAPPTFADEPAMAVPGLAAGGPVETRPHWVARDQRAQGRRLAQLRRSSTEERGPGRAIPSGQLPTFDTGYLSGEMRQILITTGAMVVLLVVLALVIR